MTDDNQTTEVSASTSRWVSAICSLAAAVVLFGLISGDNVTEVFGWNLQPTIVGLVLYFLGLFAGRYMQPKTA